MITRIISTLKTLARDSEPPVKKTRAERRRQAATEHLPAASPFGELVAISAVGAVVLGPLAWAAASLAGMEPIDASTIGTVAAIAGFFFSLFLVAEPIRQSLHRLGSGSR